MDLKQLQQKTAVLQRQFPTQMDKRDFVVDLVEEVGELAQAVLIVEKRKRTNDRTKQRTKNDIANALGDILFDVLVLAEKYELDMDDEYAKVMEELADRVSQGEFREEDA